MVQPPRAEMSVRVTEPAGLGPHGDGGGSWRVWGHPPPWGHRSELLMQKARGTEPGQPLRSVPASPRAVSPQSPRAAVRLSGGRGAPARIAAKRCSNGALP